METGNRLFRDTYIRIACKNGLDIEQLKTEKETIRSEYNDKFRLMISLSNISERNKLCDELDVMVDRITYINSQIRGK